MCVNVIILLAFHQAEGLTENSTPSSPASAARGWCSRSLRERMWEEGFPWHKIQMPCMDDLSARQREAVPPARLRKVQEEGGRTQEEGNLMDRSDSCASSCETCNCWACGSEMIYALPSILVGTTHMKWIKLVLGQILQVVFGSHLQPFLFNIFQFLIFPSPTS